MDEVARRVQTSLAPLGGEQGLLLEECGWEKAGHKSVGVACQYIGQVGKVSNGQVGVFAVLSRDIHVGLVGGQLYLPTAWSEDAARCTQARIPAAAQAYGNSPALRQALESFRQAYVLDVVPGLGLHLADPTPAGPLAHSGRGRLVRRLQPTHVAQLLPALAAQVSPAAWRCYTYRAGRKGPL